MWPLTSAFKAPKYYNNSLHFDPPLSWQGTNKTLGYNKDRKGDEINLSAPFFFTAVGNPWLCVVQAVVIGWGRGSEESDEGCCRPEELLKGKCWAEWWKVSSFSRVKDSSQKGNAFTDVPQIKCIFAPKSSEFHFLYGFEFSVVYVNFWFIPSQTIRIPDGECLDFVDIAYTFIIPNHHPWHRLEQCRAIFHCTSATRK